MSRSLKVIAFEDGSRMTSVDLREGGREGGKEGKGRRSERIYKGVVSLQTLVEGL